MLRRISTTLQTSSPVCTFILLMLVIFVSELAVMQLFTAEFSRLGPLYSSLADAFLATLFTSPIIWWLVIRPLRKFALYSKGSFDALRAQVVEAIVTIDKEGVIESFNAAAEEIFGYSSAEIAGKSAALLFCNGLFSPEQLILAGDASQNRANSRICHEVICHRRDGTPVTMEISLSRVIIEGREQFLVFMRDISSRKEMDEALRQSETRFRQVFEQSEDAIIFFKPGTCSIIDINQTTEKLYGFSKAELTEQGVECLCRPEDYARFSGIIRNIRHGAMSNPDTIVNLRKDGTEITVSVSGKVITLQGVNVVFCSFRDITDRIRIEEEARSIQARLIQANKMTSLGLLVSGVAHEINNPNNFIMANSQLISRAWQDALKILREYYRENGDFQIGGIPFSAFVENSQQLFEGITDGSRRINDIVNNLKNYVREDKTLAAHEVDINRVVTSAVNILHYQLIKYTEKFHLDLQENIPCISGSSQQLVQVVINLLMNACQAIPDNQCGIWLTTGFDAVADLVTITVRDEGQGMPDNVSDRVLEPFFTTKLDSGGTGLGLFISHSIVKDHKGSLEFVSAPGKGTTVIVKIPTGPPAAKEHSA